MDPSTLLIIVGVAGMLGFGVLAYLAFNMWREEQRKKSSAPGAPESAAPESAAPALPLRPASGAGEASAPPAGAHEVLRVLRDSLSGRVVIEIGGRRFTQVEEMQDPAVRQGFLTTLRDLVRFANLQPGAAKPAPAPGTAPAPKPAPPAPGAAGERGAAPAAAAQSPAPRPSATPAPHPAAPPAKPDETQGLRIPTMNPFKQAQVLREMAKNPPAPPKSIPEEIDELLQARIAGTSLTQRGARVSASADGSVRFELDGRSYPAVDEIPDKDVAALIRAAIQEWERRK